MCTPSPGGPVKKAGPPGKGGLADARDSSGVAGSDVVGPGVACDPGPPIGGDRTDADGVRDDERRACARVASPSGSALTGLVGTLVEMEHVAAGLRRRSVAATVEPAAD